jgi:hypothetical protein
MHLRFAEGKFDRVEASEYGGANLRARARWEMLIIHFLKNEAFARCGFRRRSSQ